MTVINLTEQDFSLFVDYDLPQQDIAKSHKLNRLFISALLISFLLHLLVLIIKPLWHSPEVNASRSMTIHLQKNASPSVAMTDKKQIESVAAPQKTIDEKPQDKPKAESIISSRAISNQSVSKPSVSNQSVSDTSIVKPLELLSAEDYVDISENNISSNNAANSNTSDSLAFNPHLKQQRQSTNKLKRDKEKQSISWQDAGGNSFYKSGNKCFMSPAPSVTSPVRGGTNWYMVRCPGKTESEKMIDNVNREMRARFAH